ncbi:MAG: beta-lactamase hydrolase domain-containing protein, partial [Candidatus Sericytochromatia bacterium]
MECNPRGRSLGLWVGVAMLGVTACQVNMTPSGPAGGGGGTEVPGQSDPGHGRGPLVTAGGRVAAGEDRAERVARQIGGGDRADIALEDLPAIAAQGFRSVISNRPDGEEPGQPNAEALRQAAEAAGLAFTHVPVVGGAISDQDVADFRKALADLPQPVF